MLVKSSKQMHLWRSTSRHHSMWMPDLRSQTYSIWGLDFREMLFFDDRALNIRVPMIFFQVGNELGREVFSISQKVSTSLLGCNLCWWGFTPTWLQLSLGEWMVNVFLQVEEFQSPIESTKVTEGMGCMSWKMMEMVPFTGCVSQDVFCFLSSTHPFCIWKHPSFARAKCIQTMFMFQLFQGRGCCRPYCRWKN